MALTNDASLREVIDTFEQINSKIVDRGGARTITPSTSNQILAKGNYKGDITIVGDTDFKKDNIKKGINLFGLVGTLVEGARIATGSATVGRRGTISIRNLSFRPKTVSARNGTVYVSYVANSIGGNIIGFGSSSHGNPYIDSQVACTLYDDGFSLQVPYWDTSNSTRDFSWVAYG